MISKIRLLDDDFMREIEMDDSWMDAEEQDEYGDNDPYSDDPLSMAIHDSRDD